MSSNNNNRKRPIEVAQSLPLPPLPNAKKQKNISTDKASQNDFHASLTNWASLAQFSNAVQSAGGELKQFLKKNGYSAAAQNINDNHYAQIHEIIARYKNADVSASRKSSVQSNAVPKKSVSLLRASVPTDPSAPKPDTSYTLTSFSDDMVNPKRIQDIPDKLRYSTFGIFLGNRSFEDKLEVGKLLISIELYRQGCLEGPTKESPVGIALSDPNWNDDVSFAMQRLDGANPMGLKYIKYELLSKALPKSLNAEQKNSICNSFNKSSRLYILDYSFVNYPANVETDPSGKYGGTIPCTFSIFESNKDNQLLPKWIVLINKNNTLLFEAPKDPKDPKQSPEWKFAKLCVQCSDLNVHEIKYHLTWTHLVAEVLFVSAFRYLGGDTSAFILDILSPHFQETLSLNEAARSTLIPTLTSIGGTNMDGLHKAIGRYFEEFEFSKADPVADLESRGMGINSQNPNGFYYAKDATKLWNGLLKMFQGIIDLKYKTDADVVAEKRFKCWTQYVRETGNIKDFPDITSKQILAKTLAKLVFMVSAQHSAINYYQYEYFGYVSNAPGAIYYDLNRITTDSKGKPKLQDSFDVCAAIKPRLRNLQSAFVDLLSSPPTDGQQLEDIVKNYPKQYKTQTNDFVAVLTSLNEDYAKRKEYSIIIPNPAPKPCTFAGGIVI